MSRLKVRKIAQPFPPQGPPPQQRGPQGPPPQGQGPPPPGGGSPPGGQPPPQGGPQGPGQAPPPKPPQADPPPGGRPRVPGQGIAPDGPAGNGQVKLEIDSNTGEVRVDKGSFSLRVADKKAPSGGDAGNEQVHGNPAWSEMFNQKYHFPKYEEMPHFKDTWDDPYAGPKNRLEPPTYTLTLTAKSSTEAQALAYTLQTWYALKAEYTSGNDIKVSGVQDPIALMTEVGYYGVESKVDEGPELVRPDLIRDKYLPGKKVAVLADFPDMDYLADDELPERATIVARKGDEYLLEHPAWGRFYATEEEIGPAS